MKVKQTIAKKKQLTMVLFGLMSAILLFVQQPLHQILEDQNDIAVLEQMSDDGEEPKEASYQVMAYEVLVPIMSFNLFHSFDLLVELPTLENTSSELMENTIIVFDSFIKNLFNRIIAPNAP